MIDQEKRFDAPWTYQEMKTLSEKAPTHTATKLKQFFPGRTRNSIIGKCSRLGISINGGRIAYLKDKKQRKSRLTYTTKPSHAPKPSDRPRDKIIKPIKTIPLPEPKEEIVITNPILFSSRTNNQCAWPVGEPSIKMNCCGSPTFRGTSYCEAHALRAHTKPLRDWP